MDSTNSVAAVFCCYITTQFAEVKSFDCNRIPRLRVTQGTLSSKYDDRVLDFQISLSSVSNTSVLNLALSAEKRVVP